MATRSSASASARYRFSDQPVFVQGKNTATGQDVGAILGHLSWLGRLRASLPGERSRTRAVEFLAVRLTNARVSLHICVVHLLGPIGNAGQPNALAANRNRVGGEANQALT